MKAKQNINSIKTHPGDRLMMEATPVSRGRQSGPRQVCPLLNRLSRYSLSFDEVDCSECRELDCSFLLSHSSPSLIGCIVVLGG
jgi:hypothetical protein